MTLRSSQVPAVFDLLPRYGAAQAASEARAESIERERRTFARRRIHTAPGRPNLRNCRRDEGRQRSASARSRFDTRVK